MVGASFEEDLQSGIVYQRGGSPARAIAALLRAASPEAPLECAAQAHYHLSISYRTRGEWDEALRHAHLSNDAAVRANSPSLACAALNVEGLCYWQQGDPAAAERIFRRILDLADPTDLKSRGLALSNLGNLAGDRGDVDVADEYFQVALDCFIAAGYTPGMGAAAHNLGRNKLQRGDATGALEVFARVRMEAQREGDSELMALATMNMAEAVARGGDPEQSERLIGEAVGQFTAGSNLYRRCYSLGVLAQVAELQGELATAARSYEVAIQHAREHGFEELHKLWISRLSALQISTEASPGSRAD